MTKAMVNPHLIEPKYKRQNSPRFAGGHLYFPLVWHLTRRSFRRASEAEAYAKRAHARWCRLYDAAIVAMSLSQQVDEQTETGEGLEIA